MADTFLVFVIDDDKEMLSRIKAFIATKYGDANIETFTSGDAALMQLHRKPDVIILDYHIESTDLKNIYGIEVLKKIKQLLPHVPVIFISDMENETISDNIIRSGAFDYITKGEDSFHRLEIMINNATGHLSLHDQVRQQKVFNYILLFLVLVLLAAVLTMKMW